MNFRYMLAFGSNLGDRHQNCNRALILLFNLGVHILGCSRRLPTQPLRSEVYDTSDHEEYLNFVAEVRTAKAPKELYPCLREIEDNIGHNRERPWAPRGMDIDILMAVYDMEGQTFSQCPQIFIKEDLPHSLFIPHPALCTRDFWRDGLKDLGFLSFAQAEELIRQNCKG